MVIPGNLYASVQAQMQLGWTDSFGKSNLEKQKKLVRSPGPDKVGCLCICRRNHEIGHFEISLDASHLFKAVQANS